MSFVVAVSECLQLNIGSTVVQVGNTSSVPVSIISTLNLTNLSFNLVYSTNRFTNWVITPALGVIGATTVQRIDGMQTRFNLPAKTGQSFNGPAVLATLSFQALPGSSAFVSLTPADVVGLETDGQIVGNSSGIPGRVVVVGAEPLLEAWMGDNSTRMLTVYTTPGSHIQTSFSTNLPSENWELGQQFQPTSNLFQSLPIEQSAPQIFYRAHRFSE